MFPSMLASGLRMATAFIGTAIANVIGVSTDTPGVDWGELLVRVVVAAIGVWLWSSPSPP